MSKKKVKQKAGLAVLNLVFILLCLIGLVPILYALSLSLSSGTAALSSKLSLLPTGFTLANYKNILVEEPFLQWLWNSIVLAVGTVIVAMACSVTSAYAFSRFRFKGRIQALRGLLILNAFPQILTMFAIFRLFKLLHLLNNRWGLVLIYAGSMCIFSIQNLKGYFDTIPVEIEEASKLDGATELQMLIKIILPLARPAIIVTSVMVLI
ncbi:MAG: ABC transporter permease subunit, partial [Agathobacter sp.]|nr:ABC transporter permease subunit [Agathobacter sp.]